MFTSPNIREERTIALIARAIRASTLPGAQNRFDIIKDEEATIMAHIITEQLELFVAIIRQRHLLLTGKEAQAIGQQFCQRRSILQGTPVHKIKRVSDLLFQDGGQHRLANASNAQDRDDVATILDDP